MATCDIIPVFPTLILSCDVLEYGDLLCDVEKLRDIDKEGIQASNMGGWHSNYQPLPDMIEKCIPFPFKEGYCWYMVNGNLHGNYSHTHPNSDWSGVLWLKVPPNAAQLEFEHPDYFAQYKAIESIRNNYSDFANRSKYVQTYVFPPIEGHMLIFPSSLRHRVYFSETEEERVALSFNLVL